VLCGDAAANSSIVTCSRPLELLEVHRMDFLVFVLAKFDRRVGQAGAARIDTSVLDPVLNRLGTRLE